MKRFLLILTLLSSVFALYAQTELADISINITGTSISQRHRPSSIIAHLMLATDVQGGLDNPESFFTNTQYADSMLSGCQWKRYDIGKMLKGDYSLPLNACETTQVISGRVQTLIFMLLGAPLEQEVLVFQMSQVHIVG